MSLLPEKENDPVRVRRIRAFLHDAYTDYIAARVLLMNGLPKQAAVLSSTAIEKCAKAVKARRYEKIERQHLNVELWNVLQSDARVGPLLNREFVELNEKAYKLRYTDDLPINFNLVIASREFLGEMDNTILSISSCFRVDEGERRRPTDWETDVAKRDERLTAENHLISKERYDEFVGAKPQVVYEVRRDPLRGLLEATYLTEKPARIGGFLRAALFSHHSNREDFETSHFPIRSTFVLLRDGSEQIGAEFRSSS